MFLFLSQTTEQFCDLQERKGFGVLTAKLLRMQVLLPMAYRKGGGWGGSTPPPEIRSFDKVGPGCKLSGNCLVFLFQNAN